MIVRLHNLSARSPQGTDLKAVAELMGEDDGSGFIDFKEEDIQTAWHAAGFHLKTDAWVVVNGQGCIVGYADVRRRDEGQLTFTLHVHPDYRGRGIGTLFIWLIEERARQLANDMPGDVRVTLDTAVSGFNQAACHLLEREGYVRARHFWRFMIEMDETAGHATDDRSQNGKITMDLVVDTRNVVSAKSLDRRASMYIARQYDVYEKELRTGLTLQLEEQLDVQCASA